nr:type VI secretion protein IcmF/TssM N-terminal domain-containing protein [Pyrinomonadaceae bacterium]
MSSWHTSQLTYAFGIGGIMSFYGIMGLVAYMLPTDMISRQGRIIFIAVVLLTFPFAILFTYLIARRRRKKEALAESSATDSTPDEPKPAKAVSAVKNPEIDRGITEVIDFLKSSNLGTGGKDAIYSLPWYLVAGVTRSGKSSLVIGSNFDFKTTASQRSSDQKLVRPTPGVDWRVSSEAVFVDVSGRLMSENKGSDEWRSLIESIRIQRPNRPIDGMILAVDANSVLKSDERDQEQAAKELRSRIDEVIARLK